jgi:5'-deoxynucleotidase YfbR-like HD superfamily hydrolase
MVDHAAKDNQSFLYSLPFVSSKLSSPAKIAIQMGALASRLIEIKRTRVVHPDGRAENDAEHSLMLSKVAPELAHILYPELDENLVARFATLHDDVEAYVGDTPTDTLANLDQQSKDALESKGLKQLVKEYSHMPNYIRLVQQYEAQSMPEARFVRAVDKLMVLLIHIPNSGFVLKENYTYDSFLKGEKDLIVRDGYKYGEFDLIMKLRLELGDELATLFLIKK